MLRMIAMARQATAGFDKFFGEQMKSRSLAKSYADPRAEVDTVDRRMRALDAAREKSGVGKAELAAAIDARPEVVRPPGRRSGHRPLGSPADLTIRRA